MGLEFSKILHEFHSHLLLQPEMNTKESSFCSFYLNVGFYNLSCKNLIKEAVGDRIVQKFQSEL